MAPRSRAPRDVLYRIALALAVSYTLFLAIYLSHGESAAQLASLSPVSVLACTCVCIV